MAVEQRADFGGVFFVDVTLDAASLAAGTAVDTAVTVPGVLSTDVCIAVQTPAAINGGFIAQRAAVTAANTVTVRFFNTTAGALDPASGTYRFIIGRP
jgi:hypothetical protein